MAFLIVLFIILAAIAFSFLMTCLSLATANAWVFERTFAEGWEACWDRWYIVLAWSVIFLSSWKIFSD
jgi:hypothetical protein